MQLRPIDCLDCQKLGGAEAGASTATNPEAPSGFVMPQRRSPKKSASLPESGRHPGLFAQGPRCPVSRSSVALNAGSDHPWTMAHAWPGGYCMDSTPGRSHATGCPRPCSVDGHCCLLRRNAVPALPAHLAAGFKQVAAWKGRTAIARRPGV